MKTKSMYVVECSEHGVLGTWPRSEAQWANDLAQMHSEGLHPPTATTTGRFVEETQPDPLLDPFGWARF